MNAFAWFFLSLRGRVSRQELWLGYVGIVVVALILVHSLPYPSGAIYFLPGDTPDNEAWRSEQLSFGWPEFISLALTWPVIAIYAKRLHDLNLSAWWLLLLPAVAFVAGWSEFNRLHAVAYFLLPARRKLEDAGTMATPVALALRRFSENLKKHHCR
jgi:uncharacterized membrane protein YhaH (DUF805 family)